MKSKISIFLFVFFCAANFLEAQNFSITVTQPVCFEACDGQIEFIDTVGVGGPFTAVVTNSGSCTNSTIHPTTANSITISALCACNDTYTVSIYNSSNALVAYEYFQVPVTSTAVLTVATPTILPATCPSCCTGSIYVTWHGGYTPFPNNPILVLDSDTISNSYFPNDSVCPGTHTLCAIDLAGCKACITFSMGFTGGVGLSDYDFAAALSASPNPVNDILYVASAQDGLIERIRIFDISGKTIYQSPKNSMVISKSTAIDFSQIKPGIYFLEISNDQRRQKYRQKIIKTH